jgi:hypothetical protein
VCVVFSSHCNFVVAFFRPFYRVLSHINHDHLEIHVVPQGFPTRQAELTGFDQCILNPFDGTSNRAFVHLPVQTQVVVRAVLAPELQGQNELIVQIEGRNATLFGFFGLTLLEHPSHLKVRVWFHAECSSEDWSGKAENSSGEGLHAYSFADSATFAGGLLKQTPRDIDVHFVTSDEDPQGMGEPVIGPVGAAIANALFTLTGKRQRELPLKLEV